MKTFFALTALVMLTYSLSFSQEQAKEDDSKIETLFSGGKVKHSGYGALIGKFSQFDGTTSLMPGVRGGWLVNNTFSVGMAGFGMVPGKDKSYIDDSNKTVNGRLYTGYGGIYLEYINSPSKIVHMTANVLMGFGGVSVNDHNNDYSMHNNGDISYDRYNQSSPPWAIYYLIEPEMSVELNVTNFFKIGLAASYRFANIFDKSKLFETNKNLNDMKLSGASGSLSFIFGCF